MASNTEYPLTDVICGMIKTPRDKLAKADRAALARKYSLSIEWVKFYIDREMARG